MILIVIKKKDGTQWIACPNGYMQVFPDVPAARKWVDDNKATGVVYEIVSLSSSIVS